ncbi:MAG: CAP domain-containing protein [Phycisphaerales bacterium]
MTILRIATLFLALSTPSFAQCVGGQCYAPAPNRSGWFQGGRHAVRWTIPAPQAPVASWGVQAAPAPVPQVQSAPMAAPTAPTDALGEVNAARARHGLRPLVWDAGLAATCHANTASQARARRVGHFTVGAAQCAAMSWSCANAVAQWLGSPPHRAILLSPWATRGAVVVMYGYATLETAP